MEQKTIDNLNVITAPNRAALGSSAADAAYKKIEELLQTQQSVNMIFAAAPSQNEFLQQLSIKPIDWQCINAYHMDEYTGLPADAPQGFGNFLKDAIFSKVPFKSVNYLNGNAANLQEECKRYSKLLAENPCDIICMGIGENTHIAFNDPHVAKFNDAELVKVVDLDERCRMQQVNDGCFVKVEDVPQHALTLTVPALMAAKHVFCMVPGSKKAEAVAYTLTEQIEEKYPSTALRLHPSATLFIDSDSAKLYNDMTMVAGAAN